MFYKLEGEVPTPTDRITMTTHVAKTRLENGILVSTVFLGFAHGGDEYGNPILFETLPFNKDGESMDDYMERYATWEEAEKGHNRIVAQLAQ